MEALNRFNQDVHYEIENVCQKAGLPHFVRKEAKEHYDDYINQENAWSRPEYHFAVAAVYFSVRENDLAYTIRDLKREEDDLSNLSNTFRRLCSELGKLPQPQNPAIFIGRIHDNMPGTPDKVAEVAKEIIEKTDPSVISGKQPNTIAAAAYYLAARVEGVSITQDLIGRHANVSSVAIRNTYRDLYRP